MKGFARNFKPLEILGEEEIEAIHRATLEVLWITGIRVEHERALKLFEKNGSKVDYDEMRVRIPPALVEECLRKCPSSFIIKARDPERNLWMGGNTLYFAQSAGMSYLDVDTWEVRAGTLKEHGEACRIGDALDNLHMLIGYEFYMDMEGVPPCMVMLEAIASGIRNSTKVQIGGFSQDCEIFGVEIAKAAGIDLIPEICASPPLTLYSDACNQLFACAEAGFPIEVVSGAIMGGTGPATIAGTTLVNNAELIALTILAQLITPGVGVQPCDFCWPMDMRSGSPAFGAVGAALHQIVFDQYWRRLGIPTCCGIAGYSVSSKKIDFQNGYERSLATLIAALGGDNRICLHGQVSQELTYSDVQAVLDDDIAGWIGRFIEGVDVSHETLGVDLINEVGPIPGSYLNKEHTRKWWQKEQFIPKAADRLTYPEWLKTGKKDAIDLAKERVEEILATHKPTSLTPGQEEEIERILKEARKYYRKKGLISDEEWVVYNEKVLQSPDYPFI